MKVFVLKEEHPSLKKIRQLEELALKLGITISVNYADQIIIEVDNKTFEYRDIEQTVFSSESTPTFPHFAESKVTYLDDNEDS